MCIRKRRKDIKEREREREREERKQKVKEKHGVLEREGPRGPNDFLHYDARGIVNDQRYFTISSRFVLYLCSFFVDKKFFETPVYD